MIKLYHTGASADQAIQTNAIQSIGGFISNSEIANDQLDALFGGISQGALLDGSVEYRCLAFVNESETSKNIVLYYNNVSIDEVSSLKMAIVAPATNNCNEPFFEKVSNVFSKPNVSFSDNIGSDNALSFTITAGQILGLWIQRTVNKYQGQRFLSCDEMVARYNEVDVNQKDTITFTDTTVAGKYWILNTISESIYISYNAVGLVQDKEVIRVTIPVDSTLQEILTITKNKLNSVLSNRQECVFDVEGDDLIVQHLNPGKIRNLQQGTYPITIVSEEGSSGITEQIESLEICIDY